MIRLKFAAVLVAAMLVIPCVGAAAQKYTVKQGDNDWAIAKKVGCTVQELHKLNPKITWSKLQIGQTIQVPGKAPAVKPKATPPKTSPAKPKAQTVSNVKTTGAIAKVAKSDVILRKGPATSYDRVARLNKGQTAKVFERRNGWTKVIFGSGTIGWMRDDMVTVTNPSATADLVAKKEEGLPVTPDKAVNPPADKDAGDADVKAVNVPDKVDLGADEQATKTEIVTAAKNEVVVAPPLPGGQVVNGFNGKVARITATNVIVRSGPSTETDRKALVTRGRTADLLAQQGDWYKVKFSGGTIGWIRNDLLELVSADVIEAEKAEAAKNLDAELSPDASKVDKVLATAKSKMGTRYVYGASRASAFDCSGYVVWVMAKHGVNLPRTSAQQSTVGVKVSRSALQEGDLVFFRTTRGARVGHVGIYIGGNKFIHASSGGGKVQINSLSENYYNNRYVTARRLPQLSK